MSDPETRTVDVDGARLELDLAGEGPAVVLLHPGLWDRRTWDRQLSTFAGSHRVVRYDARGYGRSSRPEPGASYSHVEDLAAVMDAAGVERAALVGCSMGGRIAVDFALTHPERVLALVLAAPGLGGFEMTAEERAWYGDLEERFQTAVDAGELERAMEIELEPWVRLGTSDEAGRRIHAIAMDNVHEVTMDERGERGLAPPAVGRLGEIAVPSLIVAAELDAPDMARVARAYADGIAGARLVEIPGSDHVVNVRRPGEFDRVVLGFLAEVL